MRLEIHGGNRFPGEAVRAHITRRLHFPLGRIEARICRVIVRLTDLNGPRGGIDKCCRIVVSLLRRGRVVVEQRDGDWFRAADLAADRLAHSLRRILGRGRARRRQGPSPSPD
jgi:ribosome-associated translation inhibitor RaiA